MKTRRFACRPPSRSWPNARYGLYLHAMVFLVGAWNLVAINAARTPEIWWCWIPIVGWIVVLAGHYLWVTIRERITGI